MIDFLQRPILPLLPADQRALYFTGITEKFVVYLQVSLIIALFACLPYLLYLIWCFIRPALYEKEKKFLRLFLVGGTLSFLARLCFAYFVVIPLSYQFLIGFGSPSQKPLITVGEYFPLTLKLLGLGGLIFELPVVIGILGAMGIVTPRLLSLYRKHAILILAFLSAVLTPSPDALTLLCVAGPLWLLYELSIWAVRLVSRF